MERLTPGSPAPTHDLIRLREPIALTADAPAPSWVEPVLRRTPWVVVRRGHVRDGMMPVGVRGLTRSQRFAAFVAVAEIAERLSPEDLTVSRYVIEQKRKDAVPALAALDRVAAILARRGYRWGPGGSVGFEIATGVATATASSDLDLILRQDRRLEPNEATDLLAALAKAAAPARIDVMLETPMGGVSLADLAAMPAQVLVRTPYGPRLSVDPWMADASRIVGGGVMTVAFLFPGQGSQSAGLLHHLPQHAEVTRTIHEASDVLGLDLDSLDNAEALHSTAAVQTALLIAGVATARALMAEQVHPAAVAGMSIGAFGAAVACGTLSFADALPLVRLRGELMETAFPSGYGLAAIEGLDEVQMEGIVERTRTAELPVYISNINAPRQIVVAGSDAALDRGDRPGSPTRRAPCRASGGQRPVALPAAPAGRRSPGASHGQAHSAAAVDALCEQSRRPRPL